ncbi:hypothetical protein OG474_11105 [Kribbella sp. NBC_01505]|uniref:hypothetical protein n=1 Tax=Kribbella sp. NBC_01505 TaxID=2903580 RepID=UPI0038670B07
MTVRDAGWSLLLADEMDDGDWALTESRGVLLNAQLERDGRRFPVVFYDPDRIHNAATIGTASGDPYYRRNVILLPAVTRTAVEAAVEKLGKAGELDWLLS